MVEFIGGFVLGASVSALVTIYYLHRPYTEFEDVVSPVSLEFWKVPSAQVDLPPPHEYRPVDEALPESKRAELVRKLAERAEST